LEEIGAGDGNKVIALDAETFGHHFKDGIYFFESLISDIYDRGFETATISQAYDNADCKNITQINESTWSSTDNCVYPLWENPVNEVNTALWNLYREVHVEFIKRYPQETESDQNTSTVPIWKDTYKPGSILSILKLEQSDQFWWSTGVNIMSKVNFSKYMVSSVLDYYRQVIDSLDGNETLLNQLENIEKLLDGSLS